MPGLVLGLVAGPWWQHQGKRDGHRSGSSRRTELGLQVCLTPLITPSWLKESGYQLLKLWNKDLL